MKALMMENGELTFGEQPEPGCKTGEVILDVELAGICGTDLEMLQGYADFHGIPGHEFCARIAPGQGERSGQRVVVDINLSCGDCAECRRGMHKHCVNRSVVGIRQSPGAFAERLAVPLHNCLALPDSITDQYAVLIEPLAAALEITESVQVDTNTSVLVVGAGRLANLIAQVLAQTAGELHVFARNPVRRSAFESAGIHCVAAIEGKYDVVVEASGHPDGFELALEAVRPRGTIVLKSTYAKSLALDASRVVVDEITLHGSRCGPMQKAIEWLDEGRVKLDHLVTETYSLRDYTAAFERARSPEVYKVYLDPRG